MAKGNEYPDVVFMERLDELKKDSKLTYTEIANRVGVHKDTIFAWKSGIYFPHLVYIKRLALTFGVTSDYLIGLSDRKEKLG